MPKVPQKMPSPSQQSSVTTTRHGLSIIEILFGVLLIGLLATAFFTSFRTTLDITTKGKATLTANLTQSSGLISVFDKLNQAAKIIDISLTSNPTGYIAFQISSSNRQILYLNSRTNQASFGTNSLPPTTIAMRQFDGTSTADAKLLAQNIASFTLTSLANDPTSSTLTTPNNITAPIDLTAITALRVSVTFTTPNTTVTQLISLGVTPTTPADNTVIGTESAPFLSNLSSSTNVTRELDNGSAISADGLQISRTTLPVKIAYSGRYFSTIQAAIDAAVSGNTILITHGTYSESLTLKAGVSLKGGIEPESFRPQPHTGTTTLQLSSPLALPNNTHLSWLTIDGHTLQLAAENTRVSHCAINTTTTGVDITNATNPSLTNVAITANQIAVSVATTNGLILHRSRTHSISSQNITFTNSTGTVANSLITGGPIGIFSTSSTVNIINCLITNTTDTALSGTLNGTVLVENSIIANNSGIGVAIPTGSVTLNYSSFFNNSGGHFAPDPGNPDTGNRIDEDPDFANTSTYELNASSPLIDTGNPNSIYHDITTPSQGGSQNDIGLYGGPETGRIGIGTTHPITPADTASTILSSSYPADWILFSSGTHNITATLTPKRYQTLAGLGADLSILNLGTTGQLTLNRNTVHDLRLTGTTSTTGLSLTNTSATLHGLVIDNLGTGIDATNSTLNATNLTLDHNATAIQADNAGHPTIVQHSLITNSNLIGFSQLTGAGTSTSVLYTNNSTDTSGSITQTGSLTSSPNFVNPTYFLSATSNAKNASLLDTHTDLGAFEALTPNAIAWTTPLISSQNRDFSTISATVFGEDRPTALGTGTTLELVVSLNTQTVTISATTFQSTSNQTITTNLNSSMIGTAFQLQIILQSYHVDYSPFLDEIGVYSE